MTQPTLSPVPAETVPEEKTVPADAPQISVVVPVYKVEKFVAECLKSILSQDFDSFEVVVVDDGSPDASGKICDEFAARDSRLRVFHKENGGVVSARKFGVERSRGEWICFVDSDDVLLPHALSALFAGTKDFPDADLVEGNHVPSRDDRKTEKLAREGVPADRVPAKNPFAVGGLEYTRGLAGRCGNFGGSGTPWQKIFRRNVLLKTGALDIPSEINWLEDTLMCILAGTGIRRAVRIPNVVYVRRRTGAGLGRRGHRRPCEFWELLWGTARRELEKKGQDWAEIFPLFLAGFFAPAFLYASGRFLTHPKILPFLPILKSPEIAKYPTPRNRTSRLVLLGTKFPISLLPEPVFRLIFRACMKPFKLPRKILRRFDLR